MIISGKDLSKTIKEGLKVKVAELEAKWFNSVEKFVQRVLEKLSKDKVELSVLFCDDYYMKELNLQYIKYFL